MHKGVLHREVKPSNVVVDDGEPLERVTLIDFGLAHSGNIDSSLRDQWVATAQYLSPEAAGLLDQEVSECSDLYSLGILLFECLAGKPPFRGKSVGEVLRQHITMQARRSCAVSGCAVPRALDEVIQRLLRKDPRDRYQAAGAVAADLAVIVAALGRGESEPALVVGMHDERHTLTEPAFVGRGEELAAGGSGRTHTQRQWRPRAAGSRIGRRQNAFAGRICPARARAGRLGVAAGRDSIRRPSVPSRCSPASRMP